MKPLPCPGSAEFAFDDQNNAHVDWLYQFMETWGVNFPELHDFFGVRMKGQPAKFLRTLAEEWSDGCRSGRFKCLA